MRPDQLVAALEKLGLSQEGAGRLLGVDGRSVRRWIAGEREVNTIAARFLTYLVKTKARGPDVAALLDKSKGG